MSTSILKLEKLRACPPANLDCLCDDATRAFFIEYYRQHGRAGMRRLIALACCTPFVPPGPEDLPPPPGLPTPPPVPTPDDPPPGVSCPVPNPELWT